MKTVIILQHLLSIGLGGGWFYQYDQGRKTQLAQEAAIEDLQRKLETITTQLDDQERLSLMLQTNLNLTSGELKTVSNSFTQVSAELKKTQADAQAAAQAAQVAEEAAKTELAKREAKINELTNQGTELNGKINNLQVNLETLNNEIAETEAKLAASEGDREFLLKELKRMQAEKADLERQFNDLALLRTQVRKLKEELSISRRLEWIRMGIYGSAANKKGAQLLIERPTASQPQSNFNLNVELRQDGDTTIVQPETPKTPETPETPEAPKAPETPPDGN